MERSDYFYSNSNYNDDETVEDNKLGFTNTSGQNLMEYKTDDRGFLYVDYDKQHAAISTISKSKKKKSKENDAKKEQKVKTPWWEILRNYAIVSTIHGITHVSASQPFVLRRLIWLLLFIGCTITMTVQVSSNLVYYFTWPTSVDVSIKYNDSILFPAVTICNQNAFRASATYQHDLYNLVSRLFTDTGHVNRTSYDELAMYPFERNTTLEMLYKNSGHSAQDLIVSCEWNGAECSYVDFETVLTDFGLCYTFNSPAKHVKSLKAVQTGSEGGLRLHLNIEQYEYMNGPNSGAGLKLQVHNTDEPPLVKDHGIAVPPGSQAFIAIKTVEINNIKEPHGRCNDTVSLDFYKTYTMSTCKTNCKQKYVLEQCGCRDIYMSSRSDDVYATDRENGVCTLVQYVDCLVSTLEDYGTQASHNCDCPIPCHRLGYEPSVSYASVSNYDIETLLYDVTTVNNIQQKYVKAREIQHRVGKHIVDTDTALVMELNNSTNKVRYLLQDLLQKLEADHENLQERYGKFQNRIWFHSTWGLRKVKYIIEHDFRRGWQIYKERAFNYVTQDYFDVPLQVKRVLTDYSPLLLVNTSSNRRIIILPLLNLIHGRMECTIRAEEYMNKTKHAYETGDPLLTFRSSPGRRYDMSWITLPIIHTNYDKLPYYFDQMMLSIKWLFEGFNTLLDMCEEFVNGEEFNTTVYNDADDIFQAGARRFNYRVFMIETVIVQPPVDVIDDIIVNFERINRTFSAAQDQYEITNYLLREDIANFSQTYLQAIHEFAHISDQYLGGKANITKTELSNIATSDDMLELPNHYSIFFSDLRSRLYQLQTQIIVLKKLYQELWRLMLTEHTTHKFYWQINNDTIEFLNGDNITDEFYYDLYGEMLDLEDVRNLSKREVIERINGDFYDMDLEALLAELESDFLEIFRAIDAVSFLGHSDKKLFQDLHAFTSSLDEFKTRNQIDTAFYRENFMRLDVYMEDLSYEVVSQQPSYDFPKLLSDIGGSVGLFIGGSVLSLFEIADVFIHNGFRRLLNR